MKYQILIVLLFGISTPFIVRSQVPALVPIHVDNKWGFCDTNTAMIIPAIYDEVGRFKQWGGPDSGVWYAEVNNRPFVQWIDKNGAPFILLDSISSIKATPRAQKLWGITISRMNNGVWQNWTAIADDQLHFLTPFYRSITNIDHNRYIAELPNEPGRYGVFNMKNRLVRRFEYQPTSNIYNGVIGVSRKGADGRTEYGFANLKGKLIIPFQYWSIYTFWGTFGVCLRPNLQWEVIDMKGRIYSTIDSNLEKNIWRYPNHIFIKKTNGKWQGFDANGKPFLKENLDYPPGWVEKDDQYYYKILSDSTYIFMDMNGQELARHPYPWVEPAEIKKGSYGTTYSDDLCLVFNKKEKVGLARRTSLFGLKELIPPIYDSFFDFDNGLAIVKKAGLFGVVDTTGRLILPTLYDHIYIERRTKNPFIQVVINDKMGLFDADGREIAPCIFSLKRNDPPPQLMKATLNGMTWWSDGGHFAKAFDSTYTIDLRYTPPSVPYIPIRKADKMGILNRQFNWVVQPIFDHCQISYNGQRLVTRDSAVWSIRDAKTLEVLFSSPEKIWIKGNDVFSSIATNLNYWNDTLRQFLPVPYQLESEFQDGRALTRGENRKFGFVDQNMQLVIPCQFDHVSLFSGQSAIVQIGPKLGIIDVKGRYLLPVEYDYISRLKSGYFLIKKDLKDTLSVTPSYFRWSFINSSNRYEAANNLIVLSEDDFIYPPELLPPFTVLDSTGRRIVENCELVFPEPEGLGYVKNGIYEEYGVSADQPLRLLPKLFYKDKISDSLTIYNMETSFECTPNYGISGGCNSSGVRIGSISTFKAIQGYHKIYMANQTGKYAVFTHEGKQLSGYIFPPNYLNMYNSNPLPFCESSYTHWVTYSGKEICPIK